MTSINDNRPIATNLDGPPIYDEMTKEGQHVSPLWENWFATLIESLNGYLTSYGVFLPKLSTEKRDEIQQPQTGQLIYNSTTDTVQVYLSSGWTNI